MNLTEDDLKKIESFGLLNYSLEDIVALLDIKEVDAFVKEFISPNTDVFKRYRRGQLNAKLSIDKILFDKIKDGDLKALEFFEKRNATKEHKKSGR